jgi:hypothetical protein
MRQPRRAPGFVTEFPSLEVSRPLPNSERTRDGALDQMPHQQIKFGRESSLSTLDLADRLADEVTVEAPEARKAPCRDGCHRCRGLSRLMHRDEESAMVLLSARRATIDDLILAHRGDRQHRGGQSAGRVRSSCLAGRGSVARRNGREPSGWCHPWSGRGRPLRQAIRGARRRRQIVNCWRC